MRSKFSVAAVLAVLVALAVLLPSSSVGSTVNTDSTVRESGTAYVVPSLPATRPAPSRASARQVLTEAAAATARAGDTRSHTRRLSRIVYHVSTRGSNAGSGTLARPWRTIQYAVDHAAAGSTIRVAAGAFSPFSVTKAGLTIAGAGRAATRVIGNTTALDGIAIRAANTTVEKLAVTKCVAKNVAGNGYEFGGAAAISVAASGSGSVIDSVLLTGRTTKNRYGLNFGCFGVAVRDANHVTVTNSVIRHLGYGVFLFRGGARTVISRNSIHDNHAMIRNTPLPGDDFGGSGVGFEGTSGRPGPRVVRNRIYNNVAPSHDYRTDGGGFDLFGASDVTIERNIIYNNEDVLESGSNGDSTCRNVVFSYNVASGRSRGSRLSHSAGMYLRCGQGMKIVHNTFRKVDWWTFVLEPQSRVRAALRGLRISRNIIRQQAGTIFAFNQAPTGMNYHLTPNSAKYQGMFAVDWAHRRVASATALAADLASAS